MDKALKRFGVSLIKTLYEQPATGRSLYQVRQDEVGLFYGLKRLSLSLNDLKVVQREVVALNRTRFGLLPHCHGQWRDGDDLFLLLDWIEGETLAQRFADPPEDRADLYRRMDVLNKAARQVDELHRNRLFHRDLKPENLILRGNHQQIHSVHLIDLGLSAQPRGMEEGTAAYRAPEQDARRDRSLSAAVDVFGLGQIGWYLVSAEPLALEYNADYSDWSDVEPPLLPGFVPQRLTRVLERSVAFAPRARFAKARDFAQAIQRELNTLKGG